MRCLLVLLVLLAFGLEGCSSAPDVLELPPPSEEHRIQRIESKKPTPPPAPAGQAPPEPVVSEPVVFEALELEGVRGGRIVFSLRGSIDGLVALLLDFDGATGQRPWAVSYETLERDQGRVVARWRFAGKMGVNPVCDLEFLVARGESDAVIRYRQLKPVFGLAAFFGDYRVSRHEADPGRVRLEERVFIDSGLWIANASKEDIEAGLREDALRIEEWSKTRPSGELNR